MKHTLRMALGSLRARPARTLLTVGGIVLGVAVILAISITNLSTMKSVTSVFSAASGRANLVVLSATDDEKGIAERVRGVVQGTAGVQDAVPSLQVAALVAGQNTAAETQISLLGQSISRLIVFGIDPTLDQRVRDYGIVEGSFLPPDLDAYEMVLVKDYADEQKIKVGDDVDLITESGLETVRVVGLMSKEDAGQTNNGAFGILPLGAAQEIFSRVGDLDQIDILATPDRTDVAGLDALKEALQARLGASYTVTYPASQGQRMVQMLGLYQMGLNFFSVIAIIVGAFLIYNTFTMTVVERTREIGMLRTVGMTSRQVMALIMTESVILGIVGVALGVGAGTLLARALIWAMQSIVGQSVHAVQVPASGLATSVGVGIGVTLFASFLPVVQAGRISPLEALRVRGNVRDQWWIRRGWPWGLLMLALSVGVFILGMRSSQGFFLMGAAVVIMSLGGMLAIPATVDFWVRTASPLLKGLYSGEGQLGSRNVVRGKQRTTMTVMALMVSIGMIVSIKALSASFRRDIDAYMNAALGGDLYVWSTQSLRFDLGRRLEAVPGVEAATPMRRLDVKVLLPDGSTDTVAYMAFDPESYRRVTSFVFSDSKADPDQLIGRLGQGDAIFLSTVLSDKYGLEVGDSIRLQTRRGPKDFEVAAIISEYNELGKAMDGSWKDLRRYFGVNDVSNFLVKLSPGAVLTEVETEIDRLYGKRMNLTIDSNQATKENAMTLMNQTWAMFDVLALIAVIVAALGVINTLTMSVLERTREIGMLRGMGMTRWQVVRMVLAEAGMVGIMGGLYGLAYGIFMSRLFVGGANVTQGYRLAPLLPISALLLGLGIALVVSQFAATLPARRAASLQVIEAIQFE